MTMTMIRVMPIEMLDRKYNLDRMENHGINLEDHPEYRSYQAFYEMGITTCQGRPLCGGGHLNGPV